MESVDSEFGARMKWRERGARNSGDAGGGMPASTPFGIDCVSVCNELSRAVVYR